WPFAAGIGNSRNALRTRVRAFGECVRAFGACDFAAPACTRAPTASCAPASVSATHAHTVKPSRSPARTPRAPPRGLRAPGETLDVLDTGRFLEAPGAHQVHTSTTIPARLALCAGSWLGGAGEQRASVGAHRQSRYWPPARHPRCPPTDALWATG